MKYRTLLVCGAAAASLCASQAFAQTSASDRLAGEWRVAKRAELVAQRGTIDAQIAAIDAGATPDTLASAVPAAAARTAPAPTPPPAQTPPATAGATASTGSAAGQTGNTGTGTGTGTGNTNPNTNANANGQGSSSDVNTKFGGINFGVGISFTGDLGGRDRVSAAVVDPAGIVRVTDENNGRARIMLESHYFFTPGGGPLGMKGLIENTSKDVKWGWGPFIALQPGTDNVIEAVGMGLMIGFRRNDTKSESFNIGVGIVIDPNTRMLGDGIVPNMPLPAGETEIRYVEQFQTGLLVLTSFSF